MARNSLFLYCACVAVAAFAAVTCTYGIFGGGSSDEDIKADSRSRLESSRLLCGVAEEITKNIDEERQRALQSAIAPFTEVRDRARSMSSKPDEVSLEPISFLAFDYFAQNSDQFQIFRSQENYPDGVDCASVAGIPENVKVDLASFMRSQGMLPERFRCYTENGQDFFGYLLDSAAGKHVTYLYLEKFTKERKFKQNVNSDLSLSKTLSSVLLPSDDSSRIVAVFESGKEVFSSKKTDFSEITNRLDRENRGFEDRLALDGVLYDTAVACGAKTCALTAQKVREGRAVSVPFLVFCVLGALLIIALLLLWSRGNKKSASALNEKIGDLIDSYGKLSLLGKDDASVAAEKITTQGHDLPPRVVVALVEAARSQGNAADAKISSQQEHFDEEIEGKYNEGLQGARCMLQKTLPPSSSEMPSSRFLDIASFLLPSKTGCTDAYDIFRVDRDNIALIMASGSKGEGRSITPLAGVFAVIRRCIRDEGMRPGETLSVINKMLAMRSHGGSEIKAFVMILSEFTGNCVISTAGFEAPMQFGLDGVKNPECGSARALGANPQEVYENHKNKLDFGETMLICGRGAFSIHNQKNECYDNERLRSVIATLKPTSSASDTLIAFNKSVVSFSGNQQNNADLCAVCVKKTNNAKEQDL